LNVCSKNKTHTELLNRIDDTVVFNRLTRADMDRIVEKELESVKKALFTDRQVTLHVMPEVVDALADEGLFVAF